MSKRWRIGLFITFIVVGFGLGIVGGWFFNQTAEERLYKEVRRFVGKVDDGHWQQEESITHGDKKERWKGAFISSREELIERFLLIQPLLRAGCPLQTQHEENRLHYEIDMTADCYAALYHFDQDEEKHIEALQQGYGTFLHYSLERREGTFIATQEAMIMGKPRSIERHYQFIKADDAPLTLSDDESLFLKESSQLTAGDWELLSNTPVVIEQRRSVNEENRSVINEEILRRVDLRLRGAQLIGYDFNRELKRWRLAYDLPQESADVLTDIFGFKVEAGRLNITKMVEEEGAVSIIFLFEIPSGDDTRLQHYTFYYTPQK